jgi:hypothetical protein
MKLVYYRIRKHLKIRLLRHGIVMARVTSTKMRITPIKIPAVYSLSLLIRMSSKGSSLGQIQTQKFVSGLFPQGPRGLKK